MEHWLQNLHALLLTELELSESWLLSIKILFLAENIIFFLRARKFYVTGCK